MKKPRSGIYFAYGHLQALSENKLDSVPLQTDLNSDAATLRYKALARAPNLPEKSCLIHSSLVVRFAFNFVCDNAWDIMHAQKSLVIFPPFSVKLLPHGQFIREWQGSGSGGRVREGFM